MTRRKSTPAEAPQTLDEAIADLTRYVALDTELEKLGADAKEAIAKIKAAHDLLAKPVEQEVKIIHGRLRTWWAVASEALLKAGSKSCELAGVKIGLRMTTPKVGAKAKTEQEAVLQLLAEPLLRDLVRIEYSLNKEAIKTVFSRAAALAEKAEEERDAQDITLLSIAARLTKLGFKVTQKEEFFLQRPETLPAVETVEVQVAA